MSTEEPVFVDGSDAARREALRRAWLDEHGGEAVRLESAAVAELAYRLVEAGLQPTVDAIRYVNGGQGSPNVIHPAVRQFFRSELRRRWQTAPQPPVPGVPAVLVELWSQCVQDAQRAAEAALEAPRADLAGLRQALAQRTAEIEATAELQRAELGAVRQQATDLAERLTQAQQAAAAALERAHAAETSLASARTELQAQKTVQAQTATERASLAKERDRWRVQAEEARREVAVLAKTREDAASRLTEQLAREAAQQALEHDLRAALTAANAQIVDLRTENQQAEARGAAASAEQKTALEAAAKAAQRASLAEARSRQSDSELQAVRAQQAQLRSELETARAALLEAARQEGAHRAIIDERDRLAALVAHLSTTPAPATKK
jgi:hypothetical protein